MRQDHSSTGYRLELRLRKGRCLSGSICTWPSTCSPHYLFFKKSLVSERPPIIFNDGRLRGKWELVIPLASGGGSYGFHRALEPKGSQVGGHITSRDL